MVKDCDEMIDTGEYKERVIKLFRDGDPVKPTDEMWNEMANAVLWLSENDLENTTEIDATVMGDVKIDD